MRFLNVYSGVLHVTCHDPGLVCLLVNPIITCRAADKLIPIENFVLEDQYAKPRLSPDGKYLALTVRLPLNGRLVPTIVRLFATRHEGARRRPNANLRSAQ